MTASTFPFTSRYYTTEIAQYIAPDGKVIPYLRRRFVPSADNFALLQEHVVTQGERLDNVTATYLGDPLQFWRVCDANNAMRPDDLTATIGHRLRITLPQGVPSATPGSATGSGG